jgi:hypothetical protein
MTNGDGTTYFTQLPDGTPLSEQTPFGTQDYATDRSGSVIAKTDQSQAVVSQDSYDPLCHDTSYHAFGATESTYKCGAQLAAPGTDDGYIDDSGVTTSDGAMQPSVRRRGPTIAQDTKSGTCGDLTLRMENQSVPWNPGLAVIQLGAFPTHGNLVLAAGFITWRNYNTWQTGRIPFYKAQFQDFAVWTWRRTVGEGIVTATVTMFEAIVVGSFGVRECTGLKPTVTLDI